MKKLLLLLAVVTSGLVSSAQSYAGISIGSSKSDRLQSSLRYQHLITSRFSAGVQLSFGDIRYRFIDARAVEDGQVLMAGVSLGYAIAEGERYRLDVNLSSRYRSIRTEAADAPADAGSGFEFDPQMVIALQVSESLYLYPGLMMRIAMQTSPEFIGNEQIPTGVLLNGLGWKLGSSMLSMRTYVGPMAGAVGDTEKFYWQLSLGFQYFFKSKSNIPSSIPVLYY